MKSASRPYFAGSTIPLALIGIFASWSCCSCWRNWLGSAPGRITPSGFERDDRVHRALHLGRGRAGLDDLELVAEQLLRRLHDLREQRARRGRALQVGERLARRLGSSAARRPGTPSACRCTRRRRPWRPRHRRRSAGAAALPAVVAAAAGERDRRDREAGGGRLQHPVASRGLLFRWRWRAGVMTEPRRVAGSARRRHCGAPCAGTWTGRRRGAARRR